VRTFPYAQEVPTNGEGLAKAGPLSTANAAIPGVGLKLWVEGANVSDGVLDTGFTLEISDLPRRDGDRVNITVVQSRIDVCRAGRATRNTPIGTASVQLDAAIQQAQQATHFANVGQMAYHK
jgi:hypothetical protein